MPWCDDCARYWQMEAVTAEGACPTCGRSVAGPAHTPWHFKLLVVAIVAYLAWRAWYGILWLVERL